METTKPKVDVKALIEKANQKKNEVKSSTEKVQAMKEIFTLIPGFSKYEFNGNIVRNVKTKNIISMKTGRTKCQLTNDNEESKNLSKDEIKALYPMIEESGPIKVKVMKKIIKERKKKEEKKTVEVISFDKSITDEEIMNMPSKMNKKIYFLHLKGHSNKQIQEITKSPMPTIARDIWRYKSGKTKA